MKFTKYFMPLAAVALLASCSNDNLDAPQAGAGENNVESDGSNAYLSIRFAIPRDAAGRADGDVEYEYKDGDPAEYKVSNGKLYIYDTQNDGETIGKCIMVVELPTGFTDDSTKDDYLTSTLTQAKEIELPSSMSADQTYKALVILNYDGLTNLPYVGQDYSAWNVGTNQKFQNATGDFAMTNALGWETPSGGVGGAATATVSPDVLVTINKNNIYYKSEAAKDPVNIYVQRVAAKVSLASTAFKFGDEANSVTDNSTDKVKLNSWYLDNVNVNSYPVQNLGSWPTGINMTAWTNLGKPYFRFVGTGDFNRVNWAEDPEYGTSAPTYASTYKKSDVKSDLGNVYCLENTMAVANMNRNESTIAVIEATYYLGGDDTAVDFVGYGGRYIKVEHAKSDAVAGPVLLKNLIDTESTEGQAELTAIASAFGLATGEEGTETVDYYKGGKCYYLSAIRHFGDQETSDTDNDMTKWTLRTEKYPTDIDKNLLGRYGVVRNNWYELTIAEIKGPGQPTPEPGDTPDDDPDNLMFKASINILSWAARKQDLKW